MANTKPLPTTNDTLHPDGDDVALNFSDGDAGYITFSLSTANKIKWWKGVKIFGDGSWDAIGLLATQDEDHGPSTRKIEIGQFTSLSRIELWKAKSMGVHTDMQHYSFEPSQLEGKTVEFVWETD